MAVLTVCGVLLVFDNLLGRYRYGKLDWEMRLKMEVFRNLKVLSCFGLEREEWETLEEFRERAGGLGTVCGGKRQSLAGEEIGKRNILSVGSRREKEALPLRFTEDYEGVVYGGKSAGASMIKEAAREREELLQLLKQRRKWIWLYCRVRLYLGRYRI